LSTLELLGLLFFFSIPVGLSAVSDFKVFPCVERVQRLTGVCLRGLVALVVLHVFLLVTLGERCIDERDERRDDDDVLIRPPFFDADLLRIPLSLELLSRLLDLKLRWVSVVQVCELPLFVAFAAFPPSSFSTSTGVICLSARDLMVLPCLELDFDLLPLLVEFTSLFAEELDRFPRTLDPLLPFPDFTARVFELIFFVGSATFSSSFFLRSTNSSFFGADNILRFPGIA